MMDVVQKHEQRVLFLGKDAHEFAEGQIETVLRLHRAQIADGGLFADDRLDRRDHVDDDPPVLAQGGQQLFPPSRDAFLRLAEQQLDQAVEGLRDGAVGAAPVVLVEFSGDEIAVPGRDRLLQLADDRRLPHARIAGDQQHFRLAPAGSFENRQQLRDFLFAAIEFLR